jgi:hypothetical protein
MSIETKSMHITPVGGNVFADLGFEPLEAAALKAESQRIIFGEKTDPPEDIPKDPPEDTPKVSFGESP